MAKCCGQESYGSNQKPKNDRRLQLINDIKQLIQNDDGKECSRMSRGDTQRGRNSIPGVRNMDDECLQYRKRRECSPPIITSLGAHEIRPTSNYDVMKYYSNKQVTFVDATRSQDPLDPMPPAPWELPRTPSQELRASTLYTSCDCRKRNGLQHDCQRWECGGRPECVAVNPGPCCVPSKGRKPVRGDRRQYKSVGDSGKQQRAADMQFQGSSSALLDAGVSLPAMMCVCAPVNMGQPSSPSPKASPAKGSITRDVVGVCDGTPPRRQQQGGHQEPREVGPKVQGPKGADMVCLCQPTSPRDQHGYQTPAQPHYQPHQQQGGMARNICCPL